MVDFRFGKSVKVLSKWLSSKIPYLLWKPILADETNSNILFLFSQNMFEKKKRGELLFLPELCSIHNVRVISTVGETVMNVVCKVIDVIIIINGGVFIWKGTDLTPTFQQCVQTLAKEEVPSLNGSLQWTNPAYSDFNIKCHLLQWTVKPLKAKIFSSHSN